MGNAEIKAGRCGPAQCMSPSRRLHLTCIVDGMRSGQHTTSSAKLSARLGDECTLGRQFLGAKTMEIIEKLPMARIGQDRT
jgi:hypothetical protein